MSGPEGLLHVLRGRPLTLHFSLLNPVGAEREVRVPATLVGLVALAVTDTDGRPVYEQERPKLKLKLDPAKPESYLALQPGATFGVVLEIDRDDLWLDPGMYTVRADYESGPFTLGPTAVTASADLTL